MPLPLNFNLILTFLHLFFSPLYWFLMDFTSCIPIPLISLYLPSALCPCNLSHKPNPSLKGKPKIKQNIEITQNKNKKMNLVGAVYPPVHSSLFTSVHCHESLFRVKTSGFNYMTNNELSWGSSCLYCCCPLSWRSSCLSL